MEKVRIIVDSACDITEEMSREYDIKVITMPVLVDGKLYEEYDGDAFYEMMAGLKELPTTSQIPYEEMYNMFEEAVREGESVIMLTISSKGSGTFSTANLVKKDILEKYPDADIHIIDSMFYTKPYALAAVKIRKMLNEGKGIEEAVEAAKDYLYRTRVNVLVKSLAHLNKGGRINKASFLVGSMLHFNPILMVRNGIMDKADVLKGSKNLNERLIDKILSAEDLDKENPGFYICHGKDETNALAMQKLIIEKTGMKDVPIYKLGRVIATHIGPGVLAVFYNSTKRIDE